MSEPAAAGAPPPADMEEAPAPFAWLTWALLAVLTLVFAGELLLPASPGEDWLSPSVQTLIAWGGMSRTLVIDRGEWFRLITAAGLHGGLGHLAMNGLALLMAGSALELLMGRLWLAALLVLGALGGGLASVHFNAPNIIGVGASGAIMALFGFFLAIAFRFDKGPVRRAFLINSLGALIPSLAPGLIPTGGFQIDYAAHAGGAVVGAALGAVFVLIWRRDARYPPFRLLAALIIAAGLGAVAAGAPTLLTQFSEARFVGSLIPDADLPKTDADAFARADDLIHRHANDPRGYFYKALSPALRSNAAERARLASAAVLRAERYPDVFLPRFRLRLRATLAMALHESARPAEAQAAAAPVCAAPEEAGDVLAGLRRAGLCR